MTRKTALACLGGAVLLGAASLASCNILGALFGFNRFQVQYTASADRSAATANINAGRPAIQPAPVLAAGDYTADTLVAEVTPGRFILPVNQVFFFPPAGSGDQGFLEITDSGNYWDTGDASLYLADFTDPEAVNEYTPNLSSTTSYFSHLLVNLKFNPNTITIVDSTGASKTFTNKPTVEIPLPAGYAGVQLAIESDAVQRVTDTAGDRLVCSDVSAMANVAYPQGIEPAAWIFGNADTTQIWTSPVGEGAGVNIGMNRDWYHGMAGQSVTLLRGPFAGLDLPLAYSTATVKVRFDTTNLVQICAGPDLTPFTADDTFRFAPEFWNRVQVSCEVQ